MLPFAAAVAVVINLGGAVRMLAIMCRAWQGGDGHLPLVSWVSRIGTSQSARVSKSARLRAPYGGLPVRLPTLLHQQISVREVDSA